MIMIMIMVMMGRDIAKMSLWQMNVY